MRVGLFVAVARSFIKAAKAPGPTDVLAADSTESGSFTERLVALHGDGALADMAAMDVDGAAVLASFLEEPEAPVLRDPANYTDPDRVQRRVGQLHGPQGWADLARQEADSAFPIPKAVECWMRETIGPLSRFEVNHYYIRAWDQALSRRLGRYQNMSGQGIAEETARLRGVDLASNQCRSADRALRFKDTVARLQGLSWVDRKQQFHTGDGPGGTYCVPGYSGPTPECRPHFLTANTMVNGEDAREAAMVREWIDFHTAVGFDHFVVTRFPHMLKETEHMLQPFIDHGIVTLAPWRDASGRVRPDSEWQDTKPTINFFEAQLGPANVHMVAPQKQLKQAFWAGVIDLDEYYFPSALPSMRAALTDSTSLDGRSPKMFFTPWTLFGSSGWRQMPDQTQVSAFRFAASRRSGNGKSLVLLDALDLDEWKGFPHHFELTGDYQSCSLEVHLGPWRICSGFWGLYHALVAATYLAAAAAACLGYFMVARLRKK